MASSFSVSKYTGSSAGTETTGMTVMHLILTDVAANVASGAGSYQDSDKQITIPTSGSAYSMEAYFKGKWGGTYNSITNVKFWRSESSIGTGITVNAAATSTGATPVATASSVATSAIPTSEGSALTPSVLGSAPNNTTQFIVLQMVVGTTASPGDVTASTYNWKWTES